MITVKYPDTIPEHHKEVFQAIEHTTYSPRFTEIEKRTGIPKTTIYTRWKNIKQRYNIQIKIQIKEVKQ